MDVPGVQLVSGLSPFSYPLADALPETGSAKHENRRESDSEVKLNRLLLALHSV
jgi:hypothetical protein